MDINLPINLQNSSTLNKLIDNSLGLKIGQKLDVKVIGALLKAEINTIALKLSNNTITVQSSQPIKLAPGQELQIQVTKIAPALEFALIISSPDLKRQSIPPDLRLKLIATSTDKSNTDSTATASLPVKQPLAAKIIALTDTKIQLQVFTETDTPLKQQKSVESNLNKPSIVIAIDRSQLQMPKTTAITASISANTTSLPSATTPDFKVGQAVMLEIASKGTTTEYKISAEPPPTTEETVTGFIKQFLPKHEPAPVLLNQLIKVLPELIKNNSVPEVLQRIAAEILQNLPQRQQLNEGTVLKQSVVNSGLFLEAKLPELNENPELNLDQDFKANLLKLVDALKKEVIHAEKPETQSLDMSAVKNLHQKTENNIAKIILDQLTSLPKEDSPKQIWAIDIPYIDRGQANTVSLQITRDKENNPQSDHDKWSVTITMTPPGLGTIQCTLSYRNETINTYFRSQQAQTTELINHNLDYLKQQLEAAGLKTGIIHIQDGLQPTKPAYQNAKNTLFDETA